MSDLIERLRSNQTLPLCPFERKSPEYFTTPNDQPCKFCGGLPEGPDKCTGADMRIMGEAADALAAKDAEIAQLREELAATYEELIEHNGDSLDDTRAKRVSSLREPFL